MTKFAVVDLETTGQAPTKGAQIIEVGIVIVEDGTIKEKYATYVNPNQEIPTFISNLTGITFQEVEHAPSFHEVAEHIKALCEGAYFVAHHVQFDLGFLNESLMAVGLSPLHEKVIDTVELARILAPRSPGYKLAQIAEYFEINHQHPHRALSDAYVTAEILLKLLNKAKNLPIEVLEQLIKLESKLKSDLYGLLSEWTEEKRYSIDQDEGIEIYRGLALKKQHQHNRVKSEITSSFGDFMDDVFSTEGGLHQAMEDYEPREGQKDMAEMIYGAFHEQNHALIEAETGTGKTLAYLLPSLYFSMQQGERLVISTYTTQLQTQLLEQEIPLMKRLFPDTFEAVVMKGKSHYLSLKRFVTELNNSPLDDNYDVILTKAMLLIWLMETHTGDVDELQLPSSGKIFWRKINAEAEVQDPKSPWFSRTFYQRAKRRAQKANLIITNHALLCTDIIHDYELLPSYQFLVVDEAHHLDQTASKHFGMQLDYVSIQYLLNDMAALETFEQDIERVNLLTETREKADVLFRFLFDFVRFQRNRGTSYNDIGRIQSIFELDKLDEKTGTNLGDLTSRLIFSLKDLIVELDQDQEKLEETAEDEQRKEEIMRLTDQLESLIQKLKVFLFEKDQTLVKWIEIEAHGAKNAVYLYAEPIEIGPLLKEKLYDEKESIVLTSATLTVRNSFSYILARNGLQQSEVTTQKIPSPFSYEEQVQLLLPNDLPDIKEEEDDFISAISYSIYELAKVTSGRMLVLFTSYQMLKKSYQMLKGLADQDDFIIIGQGVSSGSRTRLQKNFQSFNKAILLGTSSFWEGVDIPGDDLSAVVIVRLPFEPPNHPVYSARSELLKKQGKNPFMDLALPNAVIRFKQGFGRLIRSSKDRGIVFVCDGRLMRARYGKYFMDSIPTVPVSYEDTENILKKANEWF
ncbi:ATP-dependent DNA helicase DinG [Salinibacillus xinjiangensis]|uniref:3'-5' exonuclease DinG n=1 Tax=Salinibacillus xinjiangensis TaxID=1229268 RepID=A0A6G1XBB1_9BACI|nr:ATP-dependent DNA helicase DinG [Salinibacillus xinjiangensis]MRG88274.1 ATP-dependent DNA helicase DinG [Salinibacillus xinjiangensis]